MSKPPRRRIGAATPVYLVMFTVLCAVIITGPASAQMKIEATSPNGETTLVVDIEVKPGSEAEFEQAFGLSIRCSRLEPGNVVFNAHKVRDQPGRYVLYEIWRSPEALIAHFDRPYTKALFKNWERTLVKSVTDGGLRFISEMEPAKRLPPVAGDPSSVAECR